MARRKKKKVHKGKFLRFIILLLLLLAGVISLLLYAPFFNVAEVSVYGNDAVEKTQVVESSGINMGQNIFKISKNNVEKNIKRISRIDKVSVKRKLPNRVEITVSETYPCLIYPFMSGFAVTNENGKVIELLDNADELLLPHIFGVEVLEAKACEQIKVKDEIAYEMISECILSLKEYEVLPLFKSIDFSNTSNLFAYTHEGTKVIFGKMTDMEYKVKVLADVINKVEKSEGSYIDLSTPSAAVYGVEEPTEAPAEEPIEETENTENTEENPVLDENETGENTSAE